MARVPSDITPFELVPLSRGLAAILRHRVFELGIRVRDDGFVNLGELLANDVVKDCVHQALQVEGVVGDPVSVVRRLVASSLSKGRPRFELRDEGDGEVLIRATRKQSIHHLGHDAKLFDQLVASNSTRQEPVDVSLCIAAGQPAVELVIGSLPTDFTEYALRQLVEPYGHILSTRILPHQNCGFVRFACEEVAAAAMQALSGIEVDGRHLVVRLADTDGRSIGGESRDGDDGDHHQYARDCAGDASSEATSNHVLSSGRNAAGDAVGAAWSPQIVQQRQPAQVIKESLYVKGLPSSATEAAVHGTFALYGSVDFVKLLRPPEGVEPGSLTLAAIIRMVNVDEAVWLVENLDGNIPVGWTDPITVRFARGAVTRRPPRRDFGERRRVTDIPICGSICEWMGSYGWVLPEVVFDHPDAHKRKGRFFVSKRDVVMSGSSGHLHLEAGCRAQFHVYSDANGLGAEELELFDDRGTTNLNDLKGDDGDVILGSCDFHCNGSADEKHMEVLADVECTEVPADVSQVEVPNGGQQDNDILDWKMFLGDDRIGRRRKAPASPMQPLPSTICAPTRQASRPGRQMGRIRTFDPEKQYGFIVSPALDQDIFLPLSCIVGSPPATKVFKTPEGDAGGPFVEFDLEIKGGRPRAAHAVVIHETPKEEFARLVQKLPADAPSFVRQYLSDLASGAAFAAT